MRWWLQGVERAWEEDDGWIAISYVGTPKAGATCHARPNHFRAEILG
jgi:hypothetical protein